MQRLLLGTGKGLRLRIGSSARNRACYSSTSVAAFPGGASFQEPDRNKLLRKLGLKNYESPEISSAYELLRNDERGELLKLASRLDILERSGDKEELPSIEIFDKKIRRIGEQLDVRVWPVAISFGATGLSIGIIIPILPLLVQEINLPSSIFGLAVSAFGMAKLIGNVPTAKWVEVYGRKPVMIGGMAVCAVGLGSIGFSLDPALGAPWLIGCRFITGFGVAAFTSGAFMYMSDISTALNRTRTMAPVMSGFQAGTAVGPAIGGVAVETLGITNSYIAVGSSIAALAIMNQLFLTESRYKPEPEPEADAVAEMDTDDRTPIDRGAAITAAASKQPAGEQDEGSFGTALREWRRLCQSRKIRDIVTLNGFYWISLAGTQLTLLPLFMTAEPLALSPAEIGGSFAAISVVSVLFAQPSAHLADKYGKVPCVVLGSGLLSMSMVLIPQTSSFEHLLVALTPLALGSTILSAVPSAYMQDLCEPEDRAQGLALLRTAGDVGLLTGSIFSGIMSEVVGMSSMMACNAGFLAAAMAWYSARSLTYPAGAGAGAGQPSSSSEERSGGQGKGA